MSYTRKNNTQEPVLQTGNIKNAAAQMFSDNRKSTSIQLTQQRMMGLSSGPAQLKENVFIADSGRNHYGDGWGAYVKVTKDEELKAKIPDNAAGNQRFGLGGWFAPEAEQPADIPRVRYAKDVYILSEDGRNDGETKVTHCGPGGGRRYYYRDTGTRCFNPWRLRGLAPRA